MNSWQPSREKRRKVESVKTMVRVAFVLIMVALAYSISFKPLPVNLESLALSSKALHRLK